jgi:hypothetical protein
VAAPADAASLPGIAPAGRHTARMHEEMPPTVGPAPVALRPTAATAAAVLGYVTGGVAAVFALFVVLVLALGAPAGGLFPLLLVAVPCAIGLIRGSTRLLRHRLVQTLSTAALGAGAGALFFALMTALAGGLLVAVVLLALTLPLPVLTYRFAGRPEVLDWSGDGRA